MTDTQWPRYMVFQKHKENEPFVHNGTVHAPDRDMALLYARDVFGRRPEAVAMFVVPADSIFSMTAEEMEGMEGVPQLEPNDNLDMTFHLYGKFEETGQCEQFGKVWADDAEMAIKVGIQKYSHLKKNPVMWWAFPASAMLSTEDEDIPSMFKPVEEHKFKNQAFYPVITMMRQIRSKGKLED